MEDQQKFDFDAASNFNEFSIDIRSKIDGLAKHLLLVSGGIQTITIGAFLNGTAPSLPSDAICLLIQGWLSLSFSIILCLTLMLFQIFGLVHVGLKYKEKLESKRPGLEVLSTWLPLRIFNWVIGLGAFVGCVTGVFLVSRAAMSLIGAQHGI